NVPITWEESFKFVTKSFVSSSWKSDALRFLQNYCRTNSAMEHKTKRHTNAVDASLPAPGDPFWQPVVANKSIQDREKRDESKNDNAVSIAQVPEAAKDEVATDDTPEERRCIICTHNLKAALFLPCGHRCLCFACSLDERNAR